MGQSYPWPSRKPADVEIAIAERMIAMSLEAISAHQAAIEKLEATIAEGRSRLAAVDSWKADRQQRKRLHIQAEGLSPVRHIRLLQVIGQIVVRRNLLPPAWLTDIDEVAVGQYSTAALARIYADKLCGEKAYRRAKFERQALVSEIRRLMRMPTSNGRVPAGREIDGLVSILQGSKQRTIDLGALDRDQRFYSVDEIAMPQSGTEGESNASSFPVIRTLRRMPGGPEMPAHHVSPLGVLPELDQVDATMAAMGADPESKFQAFDVDEFLATAKFRALDTGLRNPLITMPTNGLHHFEELSKDWREHGISTTGLPRSTQSMLRDASEAEALQGSSPLVIASSIVEWKDLNGKWRKAPLVLQPVRYDPDSQVLRPMGLPVTNEALLARLRAEGLDASVEVGDGADAKLAIIDGEAARIRPIASLPALGIFASARSHLARSLDVALNPLGRAARPIRLLAEGYEGQGSAQGRSLAASRWEDGSAELKDPAQFEAVRRALHGESLIIQGPPGTGKSQTIVEIAKAMAASGLRVLISAALPEALQVVGRALLSDRTHFTFFEAKDGDILSGGGKDLDDWSKLRPICIGTPIAVCQELPVDIKFDCIIFDEASQLRLADALALCVRGDQLVVAGDSRQMQPVWSVGEMHDGALDVSLLTRAVQCGLPSVLLDRHYRSRHESLIAYSNRFHYDGKLVVMPSLSLKQRIGVEICYCPAAAAMKTDDGIVNVHEALVVAAQVRELIAEGDKTFAVICLSKAQRDLVASLVDPIVQEARQMAPEGEDASAWLKKPVLIRTAGAIQGEERDVVLISLCYAFGPDGRPPKNFGVIGRRGGRAMANVMMSRARWRTSVITSLKADDFVSEGISGGKAVIWSILAAAGHAVAVSSVRGLVPAHTADRYQSNGFAIDDLGLDGFVGVRSPLLDRYYQGFIPIEEGTEGTADQVEYYRHLHAMGWDVGLAYKGEVFENPGFPESLRRDLHKITSVPPKAGK